MKINARLVVTSVNKHTECITESHITHGKMLGITELDRKYRKRDKNDRDVETVNKHLVNARLTSLGGQDEEHTTEENVEFHAAKKYHSHIGAVIHKHKHLFSGQLGYIHAITRHMDLVSGARPFKYAPYRAVRKAMQLLEFKINLQLKDSFIEHCNSGWAAPVLFEPKKADDWGFELSNES